MNILKSIFKPKDYRTYVPEKITDITGQIIYLRSDKTLTSSRPVGSFNLIPIEELISFQQERIKVLNKIAKNKDKIDTIKDLNHYYNKMCSHCQELFLKFRTSAVPCEQDYKTYSYADIIQQAIDNGY